MTSATAYRAIFRRSFKIALVVGTILNLINQGEALFAGEPLKWGHIALNYCVPFLVASYSAIRSSNQQRQS